MHAAFDPPIILYRGVKGCMHAYMQHGGNKCYACYAVTGGGMHALGMITMTTTIPTPVLLWEDDATRAEL